MNSVDFVETITVCDLKVGRCRQLIEFMKVYEYSRSWSFFDLGPIECHLHMKIKTCFSHWAILTKFCKLLNTWK